jgi:hypothetical protein
VRGWCGTWCMFHCKLLTEKVSKIDKYMEDGKTGKKSQATKPLRPFLIKLLNNIPQDDRYLINFF